MTTPRIYRVEAIILKRKNVGEADRILTVFSRQYGKLRLIAKGIRKITSRRASSLEIFSRVTMLIASSQTLEVVTEVELLDGNQRMRQDLTLVNACYYACELVDALLAQRQEHADVYELLAGYLRNPDIDAADGFALTLLHMLGFLPPSRILPPEELAPFIERVAERRIRSYPFLKRV